MSTSPETTAPTPPASRPMPPTDTLLISAPPILPGPPSGLIPQQYRPQQYGQVPLPPAKNHPTGQLVIGSVLGALALLAGIAATGVLATSPSSGTAHPIRPAASTDAAAGICADGAPSGTTCSPTSTTLVPTTPAQHCEHGTLPDGTCATGAGPTVDEAGFLNVVRPLGLASDDDMLQLGNAMCGVLDRTEGDVAQLFTVETSLPKQSVLTVVQAASKYLCPHWNWATSAYQLPAATANTITDGTWTVAEDVPAGTYKTTGSGADCYWSLTKSGSNGDDIINNHIGGGNLRVTLKKGQDFETDRCGTWTKIK